MHIAERLPSTTWEPVLLADDPQNFIWAWFKPPAAPQGGGYQQNIVSRRQFDGLEQAERDFDAYRKSLQTLLTKMGTANSTAVQEGERRAQQIMTRVAAQIRTSREKR